MWSGVETWKRDRGERAEEIIGFDCSSRKGTGKKERWKFR
jgi:hypothetical protein